MSSHDVIVANKHNMQNSGVSYSRGNLNQLAGYLLGGDMHTAGNFLISGGTQSMERYWLLYRILLLTEGTSPIIILHNNDDYLRETVYKSYEDSGRTLDNVWDVTDMNRIYEPFLGMSVMQIISTCRKIALALHYDVLPRFDKVVRAVTRILELKHIQFSLTSFYQSTRFSDNNAFHNWVMDLPCSENEARNIWADLGIDNPDCQYDLFKSVIQSLCQEAFQSGWSGNNTISFANFIQAVGKGKTILLPFDGISCPALTTYIVSELQLLKRQRLSFYIDDIVTNNDEFIKFLTASYKNISIGVISENAAAIFPNDERAFTNIAGRMNRMIFFKHSIANDAETISGMFGEYEHERVEETSGTAKRFGSIFPWGTQNSKRTIIEDRKRILPNQIIDLRPWEGYIFNTDTNEVIHFDTTEK